MADLRKAFEDVEQKKLLADNELREKQITELNKFHRRKVLIELLKPASFNLCAPENIMKVTGTLTEVNRKVDSFTLDNCTKSQNLRTFPISHVVSVELT